MAGNNDLASTGRPESAPDGERPAIQRVRLRIAYNRDVQEGRPLMDRQQPSQSDKPGGTLDRNLQGKIGRMLRDVYSDVSEEPVPERFVKLLEALEAREKSR